MYICTYVCTYIGMKCIHSIILSGYLTICFFSIFFFLVLMEELNLLLFASEIKIVKRDLNLMAISISINQKSCIACEEMNDDGLMVYCVTLLLTYIYIFFITILTTILYYEFIIHTHLQSFICTSKNAQKFLSSILQILNFCFTYVCMCLNLGLSFLLRIISMKNRKELRTYHTRSVITLPQ